MTSFLPRPVWRFIDPVSFATTAAADVFSTMRQQISSSSQYWQVVTSPNTGSNSLLLRALTPPDIPSQENTTLTGLYVVVANGITGTSAYRQPDTSGSNESRIQVGLFVGSGSFLGPQRDEPFAGSTGAWSKYYHAAVITSLSQSYFVEAEELIALGWREAVSIVCTVAGAIIEGAAQPRGQPVRVCGIITTGAGNPVSFWGGNTFMGHGSNSRAAVFPPTDGLLISGGWEFMDRTIRGVSATSYITGSTRLLEPVHFYLLSASNALLGYARGMYVTGDAMGLQHITQSGGVSFARIYSTSRTTASDAMAFAPMSGSSYTFGPAYRVQ